MNLYKTIKDRVTTRQAAEHYGLPVNHNGMARCPFHEDHTPSLKLDERYYCFGCGATGDVIDFTAGLFGLSTKDAAEKLITDFGIGASQKAKQFHSPPEKNAEQFPDRERLCICVFRDYLRLLNIWSVKYRPESSDELFHARFVEAVTYLPEVNHILDCLLSNDHALVQKTVDLLRKDGFIDRLAMYVDAIQEEERRSFYEQDPA